MLTSRQINILKVIIDDYIAKAVPVGSKTLKVTYKLPYSTATIRNEMAYLEEAGLLEKTHTSSGRIPSNEGYRYYVDYLIEEEDVDELFKSKLEDLFHNKKLELEDVVKEACNIIASMTNYTSIALGADNKEEVLAKIELLPVSNNSVVVVIVTQSGKAESKIFNVNSQVDIKAISNCVKVMDKMLVGTRLSEVIYSINDNVKKELSLYIEDYENFLDTFVNAFKKFTNEEVYISGKNNIINQPDFDNIDKIRLLINAMEDHDFFETLAKNIEGPSVTIGMDKGSIYLEDVTVVTTNYQVNEEDKGVIAIVGPKRMDYEKVINLLDYV
ncbi:MAG: heat-inducible transcriptional repressor HrcA, partial [Erysipelotrichales bacterium]